MVVRWGVVVALLCALGVACGVSQAPTSTTVPSLPPIDTPAQTATLGVPTASGTPPQTPSPPETPTPTAESPTTTPSPQPDSWHDSGTLLLFVGGDDEQADLFALSDDGTTRLVLPDVGNEAQVSPDGRWLGFVRWGQDGRVTLELHDALSDESREIMPDTAGGMFHFIFGPDSRRMAYLDLGPYAEEGVRWALVIHDLESGAESRYEALMADADAQPLPGVPVGWTGFVSGQDELIIDTFLPYTEGGWMGAWVISLPADVSSGPLDGLSLRELIPPAPVYQSRLYLSPDRQEVAFLGRDPDYTPEDYFPEFYDLAVNRVELATIGNGARTMVVEIADGSALGRALAWAPSGERLLFAQGHYEGESFTDLSLKSSDPTGQIVEYGPLNLPPLGALLDLAWCDTSHAFFVAWNGGNGLRQLVGFDLNTGISTEISVGRRLEIVGCAPR